MSAKQPARKLVKRKIHQGKQTKSAPQKRSHNTAHPEKCWCNRFKPVRRLKPRHGFEVWIHHDPTGDQLLSEPKKPPLSMIRARTALGKMIKEGREDLGLTKNELSNILGVQENWVYLMERGTNAPSIGMLQNLSEILGLDLNDLPRFPTESGRRKKKP